MESQWKAWKYRNTFYTLFCSYDTVYFLMVLLTEVFACPFTKQSELLSLELHFLTGLYFTWNNWLENCIYNRSNG